MQLNQDGAKSIVVKGVAGLEQPGAVGLVSGFMPAFRHLETGEVRLCRMENGRVSREHLLDGLPDHWIVDRDQQGRPSSLVYAIEPGFVRGIEFWTFEELSRPRMDG